MEPSERGRLFRLVGVAVVALLLLLAGRGVLEGRASVRKAQELDAKGDVEGAIAHAMRGAKWYVPLATHPREAYDLLRAIARRAESRGDTETAFVAWQAIRAASRATRSFYFPYEDRLAEADKEIALILASRPPPGVDRDKPRERVFEEHRALLARDDAPKPLAVAAMYLGLAIWIVGVHRFGKVLDAWLAARKERGEAPFGRAVPPIAIAAIGIALFLFSLSRA